MSVAVVFFWLGAILAVVTGVSSWWTDTDTKNGAIASPFMLLLAAVVAQYLGL